MGISLNTEQQNSNKQAKITCNSNSFFFFTYINTKSIRRVTAEMEPMAGATGEAGVSPSSRPPDALSQLAAFVISVPKCLEKKPALKYSCLFPS